MFHFETEVKSEFSLTRERQTIRRIHKHRLPKRPTVRKCSCKVVRDVQFEYLLLPHLERLSVRLTFQLFNIIRSRGIQGNE